MGHRIARIGFAFVGILALVVGGCGGGGGGGGGNGVVYSNASLQGTYQLVCLGGSQANSRMISVYGTLVADGAGMITGTTGQNDNGTPGALSTPAPEPYSVAADGTFTFSSLSGYVVQGGAMAVLAQITDMARPFLCVLIRREGTYDNSALWGDYHMGLIGAVDSDARAHWTTTGMGMGPVAYDGMGVGTYPDVQRNDDGTVGVQGGGNANYSIAADGVVTLGATWEGTGLGAVEAGGAFMLVSGAAPGPGAMLPYMGCFIRGGGGLDDSALAGDYLLGGIQFDATTRDVAVRFGFVSADGAGTLSLDAVRRNTEGVVANELPVTIPYVVDPSGRVSSPGVEGAVVGDGRLAFLSGSVSNGAGPTLVLLIRR